MKIDLLGYILIFFTMVICLKIYLESDVFNLKCIISSKDGNRYCVRENKNIEKAADMLAEVTGKLKELVKYAGEKYPDRENCQRLVKGFNPKKVMETLPTSEYTAYSENKGEKLAFCLNKKKDGDNLIDLNTLTFVGIHELSHIMTKSVGHKEEFWKNFRFLLELAKEANIYQPIDYKKDPVEYCGMEITDNPYYDM